MFIIVNRVQDSITGSINGKPFGIRYTTERYQKMKELADLATLAASITELKDIIDEFEPLTHEDYKQLVEYKTPWLYVNAASNKFYLKVGSGSDSRVSSEALPKVFVDRIVQSLEQEVDIMPMVKAWARFLRNLHYSHRKAGRFSNYLNMDYVHQPYVTQLEKEEGLDHETAVQRATTKEISISTEGLLLGHKVSAELLEKHELDGFGKAQKVRIYGPESIDEVTGLITYKKAEAVEDRIFYPAVMGLTGGDPFYCGDKLGHIIRIGMNHALESWDQVDTNDDRSCCPGLHVGGLSYIQGYQREGTETHNVFIDPMYIGAIPDDQTGAIRCKEYFAHSSFAGPNRGIYHSSSYGKLTDEAYGKMFNEALAKHLESQKERDARMEEHKALAAL